MERHDELADEYQLRFGEITHYRAQVWRILCREFFQKFIDENATILDLGCGWGEFINSIAARNKFGMDLNPDSPNHLESDVKFVHHDCSKEWPFTDSTFDAIFSSNLFEHLPTKSALASAISEAARVLKPGGKLICMGPNVRFVKSLYWDFYDHHLALSDRSLVEVIRLAGLSPIIVLPRFLPYTMARGWRPPLYLISWYLRFPILWTFAGKQFLLVAKK
jgi:SAM-dependent methyltransferase